ncbi:MAG: hypothetical protein V5B36_05515 [Candidatus Accumulibacter sp. UW25]|jgi:hypothetical protein
MTSLYSLLSETNEKIDAHLEVHGCEIVFLSRGGKRGTPNQRNSDYGIGLRLLLQRLEAAEIALDRVWVDSDRVQNIPEDEKEIYGETDQNLSSEQCFTLLSGRMKLIGRSGDASIQGGNQTKRIRFKLKGNPSQEKLIEVLKLKPAYKNAQIRKRLHADQLNLVTPEHIWNAVESLIEGKVKHKFGESTDYDVLIDGVVRLAPKAVFGVAASEALGFELLPENFSGGLKSQCFRILEECGYEILPKELKARIELTSSPEREWIEGKEKAAAHFKKERALGLSCAKKAQFKREHGKLKCERCGMDPIEKYSSELGEACIEVHHSKTQVKDMGEGHRTLLKDLQCLCANCHRIVHREYKIEK